MINEHTPAPWHKERYGNRLLICDKNGEAVALVREVGSVKSQAEANAILMAEAPSLLKALKIAEAHLGWGDASLENVHNIVRKCIEDAEGGG